MGHDDAFGREDAVGGVHVEDARWQRGERGVAEVKGYHEDSAINVYMLQSEKVFLFTENQTHVIALYISNSDRFSSVRVMQQQKRSNSGLRAQDLQNFCKLAAQRMCFLLQGPDFGRDRF